MKIVENLFENEVSLPCTRVVNGFRLIPRFVSDEDHRVIWFILPNFSPYFFYFSSLDSATFFATSFENAHTENFWFRHWSPVYGFRSVVNNL